MDHQETDEPLRTELERDAIRSGVHVPNPYPPCWGGVLRALDTVKECAGVLDLVAHQMAGQNPSGHVGLHRAQRELVDQMVDARRDAVAALVVATEAALAQCPAEAVQHVRPMGVPEDFKHISDEHAPRGTAPGCAIEGSHEKCDHSDEGETEAPRYTRGTGGIPQ